MAGGRRTTYTRKGKKVISNLQASLGLQIHLTLVCLSYYFGGGCRFLVREQEEMQGCRRLLLPASLLHLQVQPPKKNLLKDSRSPLQHLFWNLQLKVFILHCKHQEMILVNIMQTTLTARRIFCMLHIRVVKNLRMMIS
jgi:hypothetical protein